MKAVEAVKEKFYCFLGNVHPTYYQSRGWGPWLGQRAFFEGSSADTSLFSSLPALKLLASGLFF